MNRKRALIGYCPEAVREYTQQMQKVYEDEKIRLIEELTALTVENEELLRQVKALMQRVSGQVAFEREISDLLLQTHLEHTKKLLYAKSSLKDTQDEAGTGDRDEPNPEKKHAN